MKPWIPKGQIKLPKEWEMRWGWTVEWLGWKRMLWLAFQIDFSSKCIGGVFFGLMIMFGKNKLPFFYGIPNYVHGVKDKQ